MLALTRKTDYAIIALSYMARKQGEVCAAREIADRFHIPSALLMNVLKVLSKQTLVRSIRGAKGGYTLARPAEEITLVDIISAIEGPIKFVQCTKKDENSNSCCELTEVCPVRGPILQIHRKLKAFLGQITLADIVSEAQEGCDCEEAETNEALAIADVAASGVRNSSGNGR